MGRGLPSREPAGARRAVSRGERGLVGTNAGKLGVDTCRPDGATSARVSTTSVVRPQADHVILRLIRLFGRASSRAGGATPQPVLLPPAPRGPPRRGDDLRVALVGLGEPGACRQASLATTAAVTDDEQGSGISDAAASVAAGVLGTTGAGARRGAAATSKQDTGRDGEDTGHEMLTGWHVANEGCRPLQGGRCTSLSISTGSTPTAGLRPAPTSSTTMLAINSLGTPGMGRILPARQGELCRSGRYDQRFRQSGPDRRISLPSRRRLRHSGSAR